MEDQIGDALISVEDARARILQDFSPLESERKTIDRATQRILAEDIIAPFDLPRFDNSSVDGFALRLARGQNSSLPLITLNVVGDIPAGSNKRIHLKPGEAARIMTGAPVPTGADRVVAVEATDFPFRESSAPLPEKVGVNILPDPRVNIRPRGQDLSKGTVVLSHGKQLYAADIGLLAMLGFNQVQVHRLPRIALFSSGDELVQPGRHLPPGKIFDANSYMLQALVGELGCAAIPLGVARDDPERVRALFEQARKEKVDLIITTAGVSVGAFDYVRKILEENQRVAIWRVNMRPGKPLTFGYYQSTPVISLPGNPVSAYVGFLVFVVPVLRKLMGLNQLVRESITVHLEQPIESDGRESYLRAVVKNRDGVYLASLSGHQGSGNLFALVQANALLILPSGVQSLPAGAEVKAWLLTDI